MKDIARKVAFVTGGASGIGLGIGRALAASGAHVALADIDLAGAERAAAELAAKGVRSLALKLDVSDADAFRAAADRVERELGPVSILCSNAGVGGSAALTEEVALDEWRWVFSVNVEAHLIAAKLFLPRMKARGEEAHLVQTVSMAGLIATPNSVAYGASKHAALGLARILRAELSGTKIGISVVCPGMVRTNLAMSVIKARPASLPARDPAQSAALAAVLAHGMDPDAIGRRVVKAIREGEFYILTHADWRPIAAQQEAEIMGAFGESAEPGYRDDFDALAAASSRIPGTEGGGKR